MSAARTLVSSALRSMTGKAPRTLATAGLLLVAGWASAEAQSATQLVRFRVIPQSHAEVAPVMKPISLRSSSSGTSTSALALSTNDANLKVTASIDRSMPAGTSLTIAVGNAAQGSAADVKPLDTDATDVLAGMSAMDGTRIPIAYRIAASERNATREAEERLVTYTLLAAP